MVYDNQTRSMLQTDQQFPSVGSQDEGLKTNADGSVDVYFGPKAPAGEDNNWVQTEPSGSWNTFLRLYGPLQPSFDKTWRPGEIELVSGDTEIQKLQDCRKQAKEKDLSLVERLRFVGTCIR